MLKECCRAIGYTGSLDLGEIARLCLAGAADLTTRGVILPGKVEFSFTEQPIMDPVTSEQETDWMTGEGRTFEVVTDTSDLTDALCCRAIFTYVQMRFRNPPNYDKLREAYEIQLGELMTTSGYTDFGDPVISE